MLIKLPLAEKLHKLGIELNLIDECYDPLCNKPEWIFYFWEEYKCSTQERIDRLIPTHPQSELQTFLRNKRILVEILPVDSWENWTYSIYMEDCLAPFFKCAPIEPLEFPTYEDALEAGLTNALDYI